MWMSCYCALQFTELTITPNTNNCRTKATTVEYDQASKRASHVFRTCIYLFVTHAPTDETQPIDTWLTHHLVASSSWPNLRCALARLNHTLARDASAARALSYVLTAPAGSSRRTYSHNNAYGTNWVNHQIMGGWPYKDTLEWHGELMLGIITELTSIHNILM